MKIEIRKLEKRDNRENFSSGDIEIDRFFINFAGQNQFKHKIGTTYVAVDSKTQKILAYATVSISSLRVQDIKPEEFKNLPNYPLPILSIARLGVDKKYQSKGIGKKLLKAMLYLAIDLQERVGCIGVFVDAKDEAIEFYKKYGFEEVEVVDGKSKIRPPQTLMYLSIKTILKALK